MFRMTAADKKVIDAFLDKKAAESKKLSTDGKSLDIMGMGGSGCCVWKGGKIVQRDLGSKTSQMVQRAVRKKAPKNWLEGVFDDETREQLEGLAEGREELESSSAVSQAFYQELRPWLVFQIEGMIKDLDKKVLGLKKGKWPKANMEYSVTRYRPGSMTHEDFMGELEKQYLRWRNDLKHEMGKK